jgi:O-antigen/teichoic acid export membrane protein
MVSLKRYNLAMFNKKPRQDTSAAKIQIANSGRATSVDDIFASESDHISLLVELPTQVNLPVLPNPSSLYQSRVGELPIEERSTLRVVAPDPEVKGQESYIALMCTLVKSSGVYALSSLASPLVSLVLAPLLTHSLSRDDYGALTVINTAIALVAGITQLGLINAFFRAYSWDYESQSDRLRVLSTTVALLLCISVPVAIVIMLGATWLSGLLFGSAAYSVPIGLSAWVILLQNLSVPGFAWLRAENRALLFALLSIFNLLVCLLGTFILVGVLHMGVSGSLIAVGGGYAAVVTTLIPVILIRAGLRPHPDIVRNLLSFGVPLSANLVSVWVLQLSDRYLLSHLGSLAQTASYSVAYTLGGLSGVVILSPFSLAWPSIMFTIAKRNDARQVFQVVFRWFSIILLFATFGLSLVGVVILNWFFPTGYHPAAPVIPIVATSVMFYGLFHIFSTGTSVLRKTWYDLILTTSSASVNVGCNLILIPLYGSMGAAASTLIAYMLLAIITYVANQRVYPIPFEVGTFSLALIIGVALYIGSNVLAQKQDTYIAWAISLVTLCLYGGSLLLLIQRYKVKAFMKGLTL